jgi:GntR family transcriptional repressor for pyruvate dehydrogenase complex
LAAQFAVSRTVVREASRALAAKGLIEVKAGSGVVARTPTFEHASQSISLFLLGDRAEIDRRKVIEVRGALEVDIAGLAAERRTAENIAEMDGIMADTRGIRERWERFVEWDLSFHAALARATQNELFSLLLDSLGGVLRRVREIGFDARVGPPNAIKHHGAILAQVKAGDAERARDAMRDHLREAEQTLAKGLTAKNTKSEGK